MNNKFLLTSAVILFTTVVDAQHCFDFNRSPSWATWLCSYKLVDQPTVSPCVGDTIPIQAPCSNGGNIYRDVNPYWYRISCYSSGTLGFNITPYSGTDDYNWALFDVTGLYYNDINNVYTDPSLIVAYNWSGEIGVTGASNAGTSLFVCGTTSTSSYRPLFSSMPDLIQGHQYLLMISHFTGSEQNGFKLEIKGGTASIGKMPPSLISFSINCDHASAKVKADSYVHCSSVAPDGSDFVLSPAIARVTSARGYVCNLSTGYDSDSLLLTFSQPLPPGNYYLVAQKGSDSNTVVDDCGIEMTIGSKLPFTVKFDPTSMDSIAPVGCAPDKLTLAFKKNIQCVSIAADGSDFFVTGPNPVNIIGASGNCNTDGTTGTITISLSQPVSTSGTYILHLKNGSDGNTIIDTCGVPTPSGESISFTTADTVNAAFTYAPDWGCKFNTFNFFHDGRNGVNSWLWTFEDQGGSIIQNPRVIYENINGSKTVKLMVSNGVCSDSNSQTIATNNQLTASFTAADLLCPEDLAVFKDTSTGNIKTWYWDFDNGATANTKIVPPQAYPIINSSRVYTIHLIVGDGTCLDTAYKNMTVVKSCYIAVPNVFTPNNDNLNDFLYPLNAYKADNLDFKVYNHYGQLVFQTTNWLVKWDGTINGNPQPAGTYVWYLRYINRDTGKKIFLKGTTVLVR